MSSLLIGNARNISNDEFEERDEGFYEGILIDSRQISSVMSLQVGTEYKCSSTLSTQTNAVACALELFITKHCIAEHRENESCVSTRSSPVYVLIPWALRPLDKDQTEDY